MKAAKITTTKNTMIINGFSGRSNGTAFVAVDDAGLFGFLPNETKPYMPVGGRSALRAVWNCLEFKPYNFIAAGLEIGKPVKL